MNMLNQQANQTDLHAWDQDHVWHAFTQMAEYEPLLIERGEGVYLFDTEGKRYIDGSSSMWCNVHNKSYKFSLRMNMLNPSSATKITGQPDRIARVG